MDVRSKSLEGLGGRLAYCSAAEEAHDLAHNLDVPPRHRDSSSPTASMA
jgi:hypothetical protein